MTRMDQNKGREGKMFSLPELDAMIDEQKWICPIELKHQDNAYYSISRNMILLPEKSQFKDGESFTSNAFHEMSHSTGHKDYTGRFDPSKGMDSAAVAKEELIAELTSALQCSRLSIVKHLKDDSAVYLKSWLDSIQESPQFLKTVLMDVKKASTILDQKLNEMSEILADRKEQSQSQTQDDDRSENVDEAKVASNEVAAKTSPEHSEEQQENTEETAIRRSGGMRR